MGARPDSSSRVFRVFTRLPTHTGSNAPTIARLSIHACSHNGAAHHRATTHDTRPHTRLSAHINYSTSALLRIPGSVRLRILQSQNPSIQLKLEHSCVACFAHVAIVQLQHKTDTLYTQTHTQTHSTVNNNTSSSSHTDTQPKTTATTATTAQRCHTTRCHQQQDDHTRQSPAPPTTTEQRRHHRRRPGRKARPKVDCVKVDEGNQRSIRSHTL